MANWVAGARRRASSVVPSRPARHDAPGALFPLGEARRRGHGGLVAELLEAAYERVEAVEVAVLVVARLPRPSVREDARGLLHLRHVDEVHGAAAGDGRVDEEQLVRGRARVGGEGEVSGEGPAGEEEAADRGAHERVAHEDVVALEGLAQLAQPQPKLPRQRLPVLDVLPDGGVDRGDAVDALELVRVGHHALEPVGELHGVDAEAECGRGARALAEAQVAHLGDTARRGLGGRGGVGVDLEHLGEQVGALLLRGGVLLGEGARGHLDVHEARLVDAVREVAHLDDDALARAVLDVVQLGQEARHGRLGRLEGLVGARLRRGRRLEQRAVRRLAEVGHVPGDDGLAQLLLVDLDLLPLVARVAALAAPLGQLAAHPRVLLDLRQREALRQVLAHHAAHEAHHLGVGVRVRARPLRRRRDQLDELDLVLRHVRQRAEDHRVQCHAEGPDVRQEGVVLDVAVGLGRCVGGRAGRAGDGVGVLLHDAAHAEVGDDRGVVGPDEDVVGLEVKVRHALEVQVVQPHDGVGEPLAALAQLEWTARHLVRVHDGAVLRGDRGRARMRGARDMRVGRACGAAQRAALFPAARRGAARQGPGGGGGGGVQAATARLAVVDDHVELVGEDVVDDVVHVDDVLVVELAHDCDLAQHLRAVG
eukprot:scaffold37644_cov67-Phaeocystis_antarctica.AAC.1